MATHQELVGFVWSVADLLRGDYKQSEYGRVVLPLVVLRRLDCVLEPTKPVVLKKANEIEGKGLDPDLLLRRASGLSFYNTSPLDMSGLLADPDNLAANLRTYINAFSPGAVDVLEKYGFDAQITRLDEASLLYPVLAKFAGIDLHPDKVSNTQMGYVFEDLIRRFSEMSNETAGEHFTPREVVRLMVNILFAEDTEVLTTKGIIRTLYDPACGTGGMLSVAEEYLRELNPDARLEAFGQELNGETYAICRSDMMLKGQDPSHIVFGNSFTVDGHEHLRADYMLANPPFGVEWKKVEKAIRDEHLVQGFSGRFGAGLPPIDNGAILFLQHMISKMKPADAGGSRIGIVFNASPLTNEGPASGKSKGRTGNTNSIRRWILEHDLLDAVIALPDELFYNTGILTYIWVLSNRKPDDRVGKVVLVDARDQSDKMTPSLGAKRKEITPGHIARITRCYAEALTIAEDPSDADYGLVKVLDTAAFGYQRVTVDRPLRLRYRFEADVAAEVKMSEPWQDLSPDKFDALAPLVDALPEFDTTDRGAVEAALGGIGPLNAALSGALWDAVSVPDPAAPIVVDLKGRPIADVGLRDYEYVPLGRDVADYMSSEVLPIAPDAWVDSSQTRIGYEIPFSRLFFEFHGPRHLDEVDRDLKAIEESLVSSLERVVHQ